VLAVYLCGSNRKHIIQLPALILQQHRTYLFREKLTLPTSGTCLTTVPHPSLHEEICSFQLRAPVLQQLHINLSTMQTYLSTARTMLASGVHLPCVYATGSDIM